MSKVYEGMLQGKGLKFAIVIARFNEFITGKLLDGAQDAMKRHGVNDIDIDVAWEPGSFEIPLVAKKLADTKKYDAILLDIRMPGMSGTELYSHIIENMPVLKGKIIIITGDVMGPDIKDFLTKNNLPYLVKPFDIKLLKEKINEIIGSGQSVA